jgi:hypothetical protein
MHKPCPIFRPSAEEFADPIRYISSIRSIGEKAGICKIIPPADWKPPFKLNKGKFRFKSKLQTLNALEGEARAQSEFVIRLRRFLFAAGNPMTSLPTLNGLPLNLMKLYNSVAKRGGSEQVAKSKSWSLILKQDLGIKATSSLAQALSKHYQTCLLQYERHQKRSTESVDASAVPAPAHQGDGPPTKKVKLTNEVPPLASVPALVTTAVLGDAMGGAAVRPAPALAPDCAPTIVCPTIDCPAVAMPTLSTAAMHIMEDSMEGAVEGTSPRTDAASEGGASEATAATAATALLPSKPTALLPSKPTALLPSKPTALLPSKPTAAVEKVQVEARTTFYRCFADKRVLLTTVLEHTPSREEEEGKVRV